MTLIVVLLLLPFAIPTLCFAIELFAGLRPTTRSSSKPETDVRAFIVVPAHNEASGLRGKLAALKLAAEPVPILVVADNCDDSTASIAREVGVDVIERFDKNQRGKGFALDFARNHLEKDPPEIVLIVDADCSMDAPSIKALIARCAASQTACQAINLQKPSGNASPSVQLSTFAFFVKNVIRQRALMRLAGRASLLGTGMALPWHHFQKADLATASIVEDLRLGQELSDFGHAPILVEDATVWSAAETTANTLAQRRRWEGGFLAEAFVTGPSRLWQAIRRRDPQAAWASLSIMVPPVALLMLLDIVVLATVALLLGLVAGSYWTLLILAGPLFAACVGLWLVWRSGGSQFVSASAILRAPLYILWKLPMYLGFVRRGAPREWVRTSRD
ncbi:glycosyltransferase family 2 protein [Sphingomonas flavescens]|uniref:glycosyltransferase family 2 protein n=1 Tax=Sphingomonas flavescens TaxID=3132797 RepID=UPI0028057725|nr:glycosyltransferase family 2 protein [Sphingomonas limnosediminicola]